MKAGESLQLGHLNERHRLAAYMLVSGKRRKEVAEELGFDPVYISQLRRNPLFITLLEELGKDLKTGVGGSLIERIIGEGNASLDTIVDIRDDGDAGDGDRLRASLALLDRNPDAPAPRSHSSMDVNARIGVTLDEDAMGLLMQALKEVDGFSPEDDEPVEGEFAEVPSPDEDGIPPALKPTSLKIETLSEARGDAERSPLED